MDTLGAPVLWLVFGVGALATWAAGVYLSRTVDVLDDRWGLGETLGGVLLLAISGTLPEIAITVTAALGNHLGIAAGNLLGGIAIQTGVLAICDFSEKEKKPLTYMVGSLIPVLEAAIVIGVLSIAMLGTLLPPSVAVFRMSPASIAIVLGWVAGMVLLGKVRHRPKWTLSMPGSAPGREDRCTAHPGDCSPLRRWSTLQLAALFGAASAVTLVAGVSLTLSSTLLAERAGIRGIVFGATVLALASALPEISSGVAAVRLKDNQLVMGDIFGGNAFQLCLFAVADLIAGSAVLPRAGASTTWLAGLGILVTAVYAGAIVVRPERDYLRLGLDSIIVLALLAIGLTALVLVAH